MFHQMDTIVIKVRLCNASFVGNCVNNNNNNNNNNNIIHLYSAINTNYSQRCRDATGFETDVESVPWTEYVEELLVKLK